MIDIAIISGERFARRWEHAAVARLRAAGHRVSVRHVSIPEARYRGLDRALAFERLRSHACLATPAEPLPAGDTGKADIVIDLLGLAGGGAAVAGTPRLTFDFAGRPGLLDTLPQALLPGDPPEMIARIDGVAVGRARPMISDRVWLSHAADDVLAGAVSLLEQTVSRFAAGQLSPITESASPAAVPPVTLAQHYLSTFPAGLAGRAARRLRRAPAMPHWRVAYRWVDGPGVADTCRLDGPMFHILPDDGRRFYADPFVFEHHGRPFLFVEEFEYATGKGTIAVAEMDSRGRFANPRRILEAPHHLSYPQVFEHDGDVYMLPESSAARELVLYRAAVFPDRWERDTVLLSDIEINDATLLHASGRFWLFGTERRGGLGSPSDTLVVHSAADLRGPWVAHGLNPLVIDHSAARPGGIFVRRGDDLYLPVQNGAQSYGGGLGLMQLQHLDDTAVVFGPPVPVEAGDAWDGGGIHTLNRCGALEVIDSAG